MNIGQPVNVNTTHQNTWGNSLYNQLSLFPTESVPLLLSNNNKSHNKGDDVWVSENLKDSFNVMSIPYLGCDYEQLYPQIVSIIPNEKYLFDDFDTETAIRCELVCAAICHQINWEFLRHVIYNKTKENSSWLNFNNLKQIGSDEILVLLQDYHKKENIKAEERTELLHLLGEWGVNYSSIINVFLNQRGELLPYCLIRESIFNCMVFSTDPAEKKFNLLLQKLNAIKPLNGIANYAKPTIDYHLLRLYLRRGLVYARTKYALHYIRDNDAERKECTVAAIRELCSELLCQIAAFTSLDISSINLVEWHVARSVCHREKPDCDLKGNMSLWLSKGFDKCPFSHTCVAYLFNIEQLLNMKEPYYKGTSF